MTQKVLKPLDQNDIHGTTTFMIKGQQLQPPYIIEYVSFVCSLYLMASFAALLLSLHRFYNPTLHSIGSIPTSRSSIYSPGTMVCNVYFLDLVSWYWQTIRLLRFAKTWIVLNCLYNPLSRFFDLSSSVSPMMQLTLGKGMRYFKVQFTSSHLLIVP